MFPINYFFLALTSCEIFVLYTGCPDLGLAGHFKTPGKYELTAYSGKPLAGTFLQALSAGVKTAR